MRHFIIAASLLIASAAQAGEVIATRVVDAPTHGQILILELSDFPAELDICPIDTHMARIMLDTPGQSNRDTRINLGCWRYAPDPWGGSVKYSGWDQINRKDIKINLPLTAFKTTSAFSEWTDYWIKSPLQD